MRKRAYHRALKRKESWALLEQAQRNMLNTLAQDMYCPQGRAYILEENPFLKMIGLSEQLDSKTTPIIIYGKKDD